MMFFYIEHYFFTLFRENHKMLRMLQIALYLQNAKNTSTFGLVTHH